MSFGYLGLSVVNISISYFIVFVVIRVLFDLRQ